LRLSARNAVRSVSTLRWWRSAVNRSFFLCLAACRTRLSAWVTRFRLWVRCALCWSAFPLAPALGSTASTAGSPALFGGSTTHRQCRHPESVFYRGSMAGLHVPLPTLRRHPRGSLRTAWGRCGCRVERCRLPSTSPTDPTVQLSRSGLSSKVKRDRG